MAASILRAETFGIPIPDWVKIPKMLAEAVEKVIVPDFQPKKDANIVTDEKATTLSTASIDDAAVINELIFKLELCTENLPQGFKMKPIQFEKVCLITCFDIFTMYILWASSPLYFINFSFEANEDLNKQIFFINIIS